MWRKIREEENHFSFLWRNGGNVEEEGGTRREKKNTALCFLQSERRKDEDGGTEGKLSTYNTIPLLDGCVEGWER